MRLTAYATGPQDSWFRAKMYCQSPADPTRIIFCVAGPLIGKSCKRDDVDWLLEQ